MFFVASLVDYLFTRGASFFVIFLSISFPIQKKKKKIHVCGLLLCRKLRPYAISGRRAVPPHIELPDWAADVSFLTHFFLHFEYHFLHSYECLFLLTRGFFFHKYGFTQYFRWTLSLLI